jgi:hypothetical protein
MKEEGIYEEDQTQTVMVGRRVPIELVSYPWI